MIKANRPRQLLLYGAPLLAILALAASLAVPALAALTRPKVTTGGATAVHGASATLVGSIEPGGQGTTYYFQYGPTITYGKQTTPATLPAGTTRVKVGQVASGLLPTYHYRLVASNASGPAQGRDRTFAPKTLGKSVFTLAKSTPPTVYGGTYVLSGTLSGAGAANRALILQASPFPFLEAFSAVGLASHSDAAGHFSFRVPNMLKTTQFRVSTLDPRPLYSRVVTQVVGVRVTLNVRSSSRPGLVRLYGTVTPAKPGATVDFQLFKQVRPGNTSKSEEHTTRFATQFTTLVKRGTPTVSRFSAIVKLRRGGAYRAYVNLNNRSAVGSGASRSVLLHAAPTSTH